MEFSCRNCGSDLSCSDCGAAEGIIECQDCSRRAEYVYCSNHNETAQECSGCSNSAEMCRSCAQSEFEGGCIECGTEYTLRTYCDSDFEEVINNRVQEILAQRGISLTDGEISGTVIESDSGVIVDGMEFQFS